MAERERNRKFSFASGGSVAWRERTIPYTQAFQNTVATVPTATAGEGLTPVLVGVLSLQLSIISHSIRLVVVGDWLVLVWCERKILLVSYSRTKCCKIGNRARGVSC